MRLIIILPQMSPDEGFSKKWYSTPLEYSGDTMLMPVPASYNDITTDSKLRKTHFKIYITGSWTKCQKNQPCDVIRMRDYSSLF